MTPNKVHVVFGVAAFAVLSSEARIRAFPGPGKANASPTAQVMEALIFRVRERILASGLFCIGLFAVLVLGHDGDCVAICEVECLFARTLSCVAAHPYYNIT